MKKPPPEWWTPDSERNKYSAGGGNFPHKSHKQKMEDAKWRWRKNIAKAMSAGGKRTVCKIDGRGPVGQSGYCYWCARNRGIA